MRYHFASRATPMKAGRGSPRAVNTDEALPGFDCAVVDDPFGNCIELLEPVAGG